MSALPPAKREPIRLASYVDIHDSVMQQFRSAGFVGEDTLRFVPIAGEQIRLVGEIACRGNIVVTVNKTLRIVDGDGATARVLSVDYSYHAHFRHGRSILRYDANHVHEELEHKDKFHKHVFDASGNQVIEWVGERSWPTLGEVIEEVRLWYHSNMETMQDRDALPALGVRGLGPVDP